MSTHVGKEPRALTRALERIGYGAGYTAGGVALLLLWTFDLTSRAGAALRPKGGPGGAL